MQISGNMSSFQNSTTDIVIHCSIFINIVSSAIQKIFRIKPN